MGGGGGEAVDLGQMLFAGQNQLGRRQRTGQLARLLCHLERVEAGDADREHDREPDSGEIDRRQPQRIVDIPRQRQMSEAQYRRAGDREHAERHGQPRRQCGSGDQHRRQKQK